MQNKLKIEDSVLKVKAIGCSNKIIASILGVSEATVYGRCKDLDVEVLIAPQSQKSVERFVRQNALISYYADWLKAQEYDLDEFPVEIQAIQLELGEDQVLEQLCYFVQSLFWARKAQYYDGREKQRGYFFYDMLSNPNGMEIADDLMYYKVPRIIKQDRLHDRAVQVAARSIWTDYIVPALVQEDAKTADTDLQSRVALWCGQQIVRLTTGLVDIPSEQELYAYFEDVLEESALQILSLRVGFDKTEPMTLAEVAESVGMTPEYVRMKEAKALRILRRRLPSAFPNLGKHVSEVSEIQVTDTTQKAMLIKELTNVGLSIRASNILVSRAGVTSIADIFCLSDKEIDGIERVGNKTASEIKEYRRLQPELVMN